MESPSSKRRRISVAAIRNSGPRGGRSRPQRTRQAADGSAGGSSSSSTPKATGLSNIRQKILTQLLTLLHKDQHSASARALPGSPAASAAGAGTTPSPPPPPPPSDAAEGGGTGGGGGVSSEEGDGDGDGDGDSDDEFGFLPLPAIHDLPDDDKQTATDLAAEIESCGHDLHHAKGKYKQRMQSIIFNLQRYKGLRTRVLSGEMEPRQLCAASSAEMQMHSTSKSEASMLARILSAGASKATLPSGSLTVKVDKKEGGTKMEWFAGKDDDDDENAHERAMGRHVAAELPPGAHEAEAEAAGAKSSPGWGRRKASAAAGRGGDEGGDAHSSGSGDDSPRRRASQTAGAIHSGRDVRRDWDSDQAHAHAHGGPTRADAAQAAWKSNQFSANVSPPGDGRGADRPLGQGHPARHVRGTPLCHGGVPQAAGSQGRGPSHAAPGHVQGRAAVQAGRGRVCEAAPDGGPPQTAAGQGQVQGHPPGRGADHRAAKQALRQKDCVQAHRRPPRVIPRNGWPTPVAVGGQAPAQG